MNDPRLQKYAVLPAIKGAIAGIAAGVVLGRLKIVPRRDGLGRPYGHRPDVAGASIVSELSHDYVLA